ncbi:MAG TPA: response regulator, partial [Anaerolineae bacterium]|nr:response regulator [Anaerolineae bacterium]
MAEELLSYKLLVIDDHPETLSIIQQVLEQHGYDVTATNSALHGISLAEMERPDLVLLDGMMPEMDGWEVCRRLRAMPTLGDVRIIMFSAVGEAEQKLAGFDAGADDYLTKPTEPMELIDRVNTLLENVTPKPRSGHAPAQKTQALPESNLPSLSSVFGKPEEGKLIVVLGARGGSGATTLAINLAASLAHSQRATTLVDLDLAQGHIAYYLKQNGRDGLNALVSLPPESIAAGIAAQLRPYHGSLQLLPTYIHSWDDAVSLSPEQAAALADGLTQPGQHVVVDCGHRITAVNRPFIEQADEIVACLQPQRTSLALARQELPKLEELMLPYAQLRLVLMDFSGQVKVPREAIEKYLGVPITAVIPITPKEMNLAA